jgi:hypothetical protein
MQFIDYFNNANSITILQAIISMEIVLINSLKLIRNNDRGGISLIIP